MLKYKTSKSLKETLLTAADYISESVASLGERVSVRDIKLNTFDDGARLFSSPFLF